MLEVGPGLEETNGKHLAQHRRIQAAILKTSPRAEPMKKLREPILRQLYMPLREKQWVRCPPLSRSQPILLQIDCERLLGLWGQWQ